MALQQGTIDAQENPFEVIYANRLYEQQDYVVETNHLPHLLSLIVSEEFYQSLTKEQQEQAEKIRKEGREKLKPLFEEMKDIREKMDKLREDNMLEFEKILTPEHYEKLKDIIARHHEEMKKRHEASKARHDMRRDRHEKKLHDVHDKD